MSKLPVCVKCQVAMVSLKSIDVVEMFLEPPEPYKAWSASLCECPVCGVQIAARFANQPFWVHYESENMMLSTDKQTIYVYERRVNNGS